VTKHSFTTFYSNYFRYKQCVQYVNVQLRFSLTKLKLTWHNLFKYLNWCISYCNYVGTYVWPGIKGSHFQHSLYWHKLHPIWMYGIIWYVINCTVTFECCVYIKLYSTMNINTNCNHIMTNCLNCLSFNLVLWNKIWLWFWKNLWQWLIPCITTMINMFTVWCICHVFTTVLPSDSQQIWPKTYCVNCTCSILF
jgi:hypothetical protein